MNIEETRDYALSLNWATENMPYGPDCPQLLSGQTLLGQLKDIILLQAKVVR